MTDASRGDEYDRLLVRDETQAVLDGARCAVAVAPMGYASRRPVLQTIGVGYDDPDEELERCDASVDLLVLGSHTYRPIDKPALGGPPSGSPAVRRARSRCSPRTPRPAASNA